MALPHQEKAPFRKKFKNILDEPYVALGIDGLFDAVLPDRYALGVEPTGNFSQEDIRWVETVDIEVDSAIDGQADRKPAVKLFIGPVGRKVISGMHATIAAYAQQGNNVVVDYILYENNWFPELVEMLAEIKVYYIGVRTPSRRAREKRGSACHISCWTR